MVLYCSITRLTLKINPRTNCSQTSHLPLHDFLRFVFAAVIALGLLIRYSSIPNLVSPIAAWIVFRLVTDHFGIVSVRRFYCDTKLRF